MIRKLTAFCLLIILILGISSSMAASSYTIDAPITSSVDLTASEWYSAANYRALLTVSVLIDTISQMSDDDSDSYASFLINPSWVAISSNKRQVMVAGYYSSSASTTVLVMIYTPGTGKIEYLPVVSRPAISDSLAETLCLTAIQNDKTNKYEKNDASEILSILADIQADLN